MVLMLFIMFLVYNYRYGAEFLQEAYFYHIIRRDIKHNFSVYFYLLYQIQGTWLSNVVGMVAFVPQASLLLASAVWLHGGGGRGGT